MGTGKGGGTIYRPPSAISSGCPLTACTAGLFHGDCNAIAVPLTERLAGQNQHHHACERQLVMHFLFVLYVCYVWQFVCYVCNSKPICVCLFFENPNARRDLKAVEKRYAGVEAEYQAVARALEAAQEQFKGFERADAKCQVRCSNCRCRVVRCGVCLSVAVAVRCGAVRCPLMRVVGAVCACPSISALRYAALPQAGPRCHPCPHHYLTMHVSTISPTYPWISPLPPVSPPPPLIAD